MVDLHFGETPSAPPGSPSRMLHFGVRKVAPDTYTVSFSAYEASQLT